MQNPEGGRQGSGFRVQGSGRGLQSLISTGSSGREAAAAAGVRVFQGLGGGGLRGFIMRICVCPMLFPLAQHPPAKALSVSCLPPSLPLPSHAAHPCSTCPSGPGYRRTPAHTRTCRAAAWRPPGEMDAGGRKCGYDSRAGVGRGEALGACRGVKERHKVREFDSLASVLIQCSFPIRCDCGFHLTEAGMRFSQH